jgi:hypothetical protein
VRNFLFFLFHIIILACTYHPEEINFEEVEQNIGTANIWLDEDIDTIFMFGTVNLNFDFDFDNREIYDLTFYLDNSPLKADSYSYTLTSLHLDSRKYGDGIYEFALHYKVKSSTNSLADKLNLEYIEVALTKVAVIDNSEPYPPAITGFELINGDLHIFWQPYKGIGFEFYFIPDEKIYEKNISDAIITDYAGGKLVGSMITYAKGLHLYQDFVYNDFLNIVSSINRDNQISFNWDPSPYYNSFNKYTISIRETNEGVTYVEDIYDINNSNYQFDARFFPYRYWVRISANSNFLLDTLINTTVLDYPVELVSLSKFINGGNNSLFIKGTGNNGGTDELLFKYKFPDNSSQFQLKGILDVSQDGSRIAHYSNGQLRLISGETFQVLKSVNLGSFISDIIVIDLVMSKGNFIAIIDNNHNLHLFDIANESVITELLVSPSDSYAFSNSNKFIYNSYYLIDLENGQIIALDNRLFDPLSDRIVEFGVGEMTTYFPDFSNSQKFELDEDIKYLSSQSERYFSGLRTVGGLRTINIFSLENGVLIKSQELNPHVYFNDYFLGVMSESIYYYQWSARRLFIQQTG